jgi:N-acetylneuraminic acid mutarotase
MRRINYLIMLLIFVVSCNKIDKFNYPLIFLGEVTDIDSTGAVFHANISDVSKDGITDYGFVWDFSENPDINSSQIIMIDPVSSGLLTVKVSNDLIPGAKYYVRAFARNPRYITYSNMATFVSKGSSSPVIKDFSPDRGSPGSVVTIYGENFSGCVLKNRVFIGNAHCVVDSASNNKLVVTIDNNDNTSGFVNIYVQVANHYVKSEKKFRLNGVNIIDFIPESLKHLDTLYLKLEDYNPDPKGNIVKIGNIIAESHSIRNDTLCCTIPYNVQPGINQVWVTSNNKTCYTEKRLYVSNPFSAIEKGYKFYRDGAIGFSINGKGYAGMGHDINTSGYYVVYSDFYEFNPASGNWTQLASLPANKRQDAIGFSIGAKGYVGLGNYGGANYFSDLWEYDPNSNNWVQKASFPGTFRENPSCIVIGNKAYIGLGYYSENYHDLWEYDPASDVWKRVSDCPGYGGPFVGFSIDNIGYFVFGNGNTTSSYSNDVWKYAPGPDTWTKLNDFPGDFRSGPVSFSLNGYGYIGMGQRNRVDLKEFWRYYPKPDKWVRYSDLSVNGRWHAKSFVIENNAYIIAGFSVKDWQYGSNAESLIIFQP